MRVRIRVCKTFLITLIFYIPFFNICIFEDEDLNGDEFDHIDSSPNRVHFKVDDDDDDDDDEDDDGNSNCSNSTTPDNEALNLVS